MATRIEMPKLGMEMTEAMVLAWLCKEDDPVKQGEPIVQIETEKITYELEAPASGTLRKIFAHEREVRPVGGLLGIITTEGEPFDEAGILAAALTCETPLTDRPAPETPPRESRSPSGPALTGNLATPAARRLAREAGVDLSAVTGTGPGGRILERDVAAAAAAPSKAGLQLGLGMELPVVRMRQVIAERLTESWKWPHIYLMAEVDATRMIELRNELVPSIEAACGRKLTYNDLLIRVVGLVIEETPLLNAVWEGDRIRIPAEVNIGLAVALEDGLVVPVVRNANTLSLSEIVCRRADLVERARRRRLQVGETSEGTFSISNLGMFDVDCFTAVINPPQSGILAVGRIKHTPAVLNNQVAIVPVMKLVLGVDHRVVDGAVAAAFLQKVKRRLESLWQTAVE